MAQLGMNMEQQTKLWIQKHSKLLTKAAPERIQSEVQQLINGPWVNNAFPLLQEIPLLEPWGSSLEKSKAFISFQSNINVMNSAEKQIAIELTGLTSLLSEDGLSKLRFSKNQQKRCKVLRHWQNRDDGSAFSSLNEAERLKLHKDLEQDLPALIIQLPTKDQAIWLTRWRDPDDPLFHPSSPLDGHKLQQHIGIPANEQLGELISDLCHERAFGRLRNQADALQYAHEWWKHKKPIL